MLVTESVKWSSKESLQSVWCPLPFFLFLVEDTFDRVLVPSDGDVESSSPLKGDDCGVLLMWVLPSGT